MDNETYVKLAAEAIDLRIPPERQHVVFQDGVQDEQRPCSQSVGSQGDVPDHLAPGLL